MLILQDACVRLKRMLQSAELSERGLLMTGRLILAAILSDGRMSAVAAAGIVRSQTCHRAQVGRFLSRAFWRNKDVLGCLQRELLKGWALKGISVLCLDSTLVSRQGTHTENTFSTKNNPRRSSKKNAKGRRYHQSKHSPRRCHTFVMGLLIGPDGTRLPLVRKYLTKDYCQRRKLTHQTQAELGADIVRTLPLPPSAPLIVLGDTAFEAASVRAACAERHATGIVPRNPERVFETAKPRPKVSSELKQTAKRWTTVRLRPGHGDQAVYRRLSAHRVGSKAKVRTYYVRGECRTVHSVGEVLLVVSTKHQPKTGRPPRDPKILMTNDRSLTPRQVTAWYSLRWQVELFFKELKSDLGLARYGFREFDKVSRWVDVILSAFTYLEWTRRQKLQQRNLPEASRLWWTNQRTHGLCLAVRQASEHADLQALSDRLQTPGGLRSAKRTLRQALQAEARSAM